MMVAALPTHSIKSPLAVRSPTRSRSRRWRHSRITTAIVAVLSLVVGTSAWLSLVFSNTSACCWHRLLEPTAAPSDPLSAPPPPPPPPLSDPSEDLSLRHIVFGIAGSAQLFNRRKNFLKLWWRPGAMRGYVWLEEAVEHLASSGDGDVDEDADDDWSSLPPIRVSEDISRFRYTNPTGHPSGLRISRIIAECFRLGLANVRWFVLGDDDTIFNVENLVRVLKKYDYREMVYIGSPSESHSANTYFSHSMAFGGGGIAISYPLAEVLSRTLDECLERYPKLYGSDDRLHACISELGVPLTRELGFHQWDIRGNAHGILAAHAIAPFVSIHHVEAVDPFYPGLNLLNSLRLFTRAMRTEPKSFLQRAICYDRSQRLTVSVSLGYVVQVFPNIVLPRELERSEQTYSAWNKINHRNEFDFDTRDAYRSVCKKPVLFFLRDVSKEGNVTVGSYARAHGRDDLKRKVFCFPRPVPLPNVEDIRVLGYPLSENWHLVPRRLCCRLNKTSDELLEVSVGQCDRGVSGLLVNSV